MPVWTMCWPTRSGIVPQLSNLKADNCAAVVNMRSHVTQTTEKEFISHVMSDRINATDITWFQNQSDAPISQIYYSTKLYMFRAVPLSIIRSLFTVHSALVYVSWRMSYRFVDSFRAEPGWNCSSVLVLLKSCLQTCMTYTSAECIVNKLLMMGRGTARNM